jgi:hypothetical protein
VDNTPDSTAHNLLAFIHILYIVALPHLTSSAVVHSLTHSLTQPVLRFEAHVIIVVERR